MHNAMAQYPGYRKAFTDYVTASSTTSIDDICAWRGVKCVETSAKGLEVNSVMAVGTDKYNWKVDPAWIPHTVEFLDLTKINLERPITCRALPRKTKYAYFFRCSINIVGKCDDIFDLRDLPKSIEELFFGCMWVGKTVCIKELPQNFRLLMMQSPQLQKVVLGDLDAPQKALCRLHFQSEVKKIAIKAKSDAPLRQRLAEINRGHSHWELQMSEERDEICGSTSKRLK